METNDKLVEMVRREVENMFDNANEMDDDDIRESGYGPHLAAEIRFIHAMTGKIPDNLAYDPVSGLGVDDAGMFHCAGEYFNVCRTYEDAITDTWDEITSDLDNLRRVMEMTLEWLDRDGPEREAYLLGRAIDDLFWSH